MGQRLNIEIWSGGKVLASAYYHWSAYSQIAAKCVQDIIDCIYNDSICKRIAESICDDFKHDNCSMSANLSKMKLSREMKDYAIKCLESTGAGIDDFEKRKLKKIGYSDEKISKYQNAKSRNEGLISITDEGIQETRENQEEYVIIYLDEQRVEYRVFSEYSPFEWQREQREEYDNKSANYRDLVSAPFNFNDIKFLDFDNVKEYIDTVIEDYEGYCFDPIRQKVIWFIH